MNYYILTANDIIIQNGEKVDALYIAKTLLNNHMWLFRENAPLLKKIKENDQFLIYICGRGRRYFYGEARSLDTPSLIKNQDLRDLSNQLGIPWMKQMINFQKVSIFNEAIQMQRLIQSLEFIKDKKNYGLHLRMPVIKINESDYKIITM